MSLRLQRSSRAPYLYASSTYLHLQHASRAPELHTATSPHLHACDASPELLRQPPPRPQTRSMPPELRISIPLCLHICTLTAHFQISTPPRPHLQTSFAAASPGPQHASRARDLQPLYLHVCTRAARLHT